MQNSLQKTFKFFLIALGLIYSQAFAEQNDEKWLDAFNEKRQIFTQENRTYILQTCQKVIAQTQKNIKQLPKHEQKFKLDIARIECEIAETSNVLGSNTQGNIIAFEYGYEAYDALLNRYYKLYREEYQTKNKELNPGIFNHGPSIKKGADTLLEEQRAWLKLRDSYDEYLRLHHTHIYEMNEGGTIWSVIKEEARLNFLKKRVNELFKRYNSMIEDAEIEFEPLLAKD